MLTLTGSRNLYGQLTNNDGATNLTLGDTLINEGIRRLLGTIDWPFLEKQTTINTVDGQQFYQLPADCDKVVSVSITVGSYRYRPRQVTSFNDWDFVNSPTGSESDVPSYFFILGDSIGFWQIPATSSNTITINYLKSVRDLSVADYTTGTITSIANGATAVVGNGTTWTDQMIGKYIRITHSNTDNTGDGIWYEIAAVPTTTTLTLDEPYEGNTIAAGTATYTISDIMVVPERYQMAPIYSAVAEYWRMTGEPSRADRFEQMYERLAQQMVGDNNRKTTDVVVDDGSPYDFINPNLDPTAS